MRAKPRDRSLHGFGGSGQHSGGSERTPPRCLQFFDFGAALPAGFQVPFHLARLAPPAIRHRCSAAGQPSSGMLRDELLIAHLLQPQHGAPQEFAHRRRADPQGGRRFPGSATLPSAETGTASAAPTDLPPHGGTASSARARADRAPDLPSGERQAGFQSRIERLFAKPAARAPSGRGCAPRGKSSPVDSEFFRPSSARYRAARKPPAPPPAPAGGCTPSVSRYR